MVDPSRLDPKYDQIPRKYSVNHFFFSSDNENEASLYWAGFLAANGNVTTQSGSDIAYRIFINMHARDKEYLQKMAKAMESQAPVYERWVNQRGKKYFTSRFLVNSKYLIEDLSRFNVVPRKRYIYTMPLWVVNHKDVRHFIRGWVDGIGGFYSTGSGKKEFRTRGTIKFLEQLRQLFSVRLDLDSNRTIIPTTKNMGKISYSNNEATKIAHWLYNDANYFLERKKNAAFGGEIETN